jgi:hypothetical protein
MSTVYGDPLRGTSSLPSVPETALRMATWRSSCSARVAVKVTRSRCPSSLVLTLGVASGW